MAKELGISPFNWNKTYSKETGNRQLCYSKFTNPANRMTAITGGALYQNGKSKYEKQ